MFHKRNIRQLTCESATYKGESDCGESEIQNQSSGGNDARGDPRVREARREGVANARRRNAIYFTTW